MFTCPSYDETLRRARPVFIELPTSGRGLSIRVANSESEQSQERRRSFGPCIEVGCGNWSGQCDVSTALVEALGDRQGLTVEHCDLRPTCRWFAQDGMRACDGCVFVERA